MLTIVTFMSALLLAGAASAAQSPGQKCETGKNLEAGKYAACLHKAEAKLLKTKGACSVASGTVCYGDEDCPALETCSKDLTKYGIAVQKCEAKFEAKWSKLSQTAVDKGDPCPDGLPQAAVKAVVDDCVANVAGGLAGGGLTDSADDLAQCTSSLGSCTIDLSACSSDFGSCSGSLATCTGNLSACNTDLGTCNTDLGTCAADLLQAESDLAAAQSSLSTCSADLSACTTDLGTAETDLMTCEGGLATAQSELTACEGDLTACQAVPEGQRVKTGQTQCWNGSNMLVACTGTGQDGDFQTGLEASFTDNGDGTVSDHRTGLMWERLHDNGGLNDKDGTFSWASAVIKMNLLNGDTGCIAAGVPSSCCSGAGTGSCTAFAGYTDWRLPNVNELQSLANYGTLSPATHAAFNSSCTPSCTTCSCTTSSYYWSATTLQGNASFAWAVNFDAGVVGSISKTSGISVRAVRGGS